MNGALCYYIATTFQSIRIFATKKNSLFTNDSPQKYADDGYHISIPQIDFTD